ncbi:MAG: ZIP family metal transporter [Sandaracinaceae bacterium]|nr:ZIP family metal transporter [Sandaracinaceae bacterium]
MPTLAWILVMGAAMSAIALVGALSLVLSERAQKRLVPAMVALAAGSLLGGAWFHMMPEALERTEGLSPWLWSMGGFVAFFVLERGLRWHHCHDPGCDHAKTIGWLVLIADGLHNLLGGLAVGGAFVADVRLGLGTWIAAAAHEVPQELGDFGVLVHAGWSRKRALLANFLSALGFPAGALLAYVASLRMDVSFLLPFAAGNFVYIAAADLIPELHRKLSGGWVAQASWFLLGLGLLLGIRLAIEG